MPVFAGMTVRGSTDRIGKLPGRHTRYDGSEDLGLTSTLGRAIAKFVAERIENEGGEKDRRGGKENHIGGLTWNSK